MERDAWGREYRRLLTAYGKTTNAEQASVYFSALHSYPSAAVTAAVDAAVKDSRTWPSAADLADRARQWLASHQAPASMCDVCHGERSVVFHCAGVSAPDARATPAPVSRHEYCGRDWVHVDHAYARFCRQCHPASGQREAVA